MKSTTALILVSVLATTPAFAGSSDNTPGWTSSTQRPSLEPGSIYPAPKALTVYTGLDWNRDGTYAAHPGIPLTADELKAQQDTNKAYNAQMVRRIIDAGGINADEQPVALASHPRAHYEAFGEGHQMGSNGGE